MENATLILVLVVLLLIFLLYKKPEAEHATLADRLLVQNENIDAALDAKLSVEEEGKSTERFGDPYADVQKALAERRFERMCSPNNNSDDPLAESLHGGSALSAM